MRTVCALGLLTLSAATPARAQYVFGPPVPIGAPVACRAVITLVPRAGQDLSIAALSMNGANVTLFRGDGFGGFGACELFPTGAPAVGLAAGDTTIDLRSDFVLPTSAPSGLAIMKQLEGGGFATGQAAWSGGPAACACAADLDGDGDTDVIVAYSGTPALRLVINNGAGDLGPAATLQLPAVAVAVVAEDLTGDDAPEVIAVCGNADMVSVFPSLGGGAFGPRNDFPAGSRPNSVAVGVFDGGSMPGLALADANSGAITILPGTGPAQFGPPLSVPVGLQPATILATDLDRNGRTELLAPLGGSPELAVLTRGIQGGWSLLAYPLPARAVGAALGDFDGDGDDDIALSLVGETGLRVIENRSSVDPCRADFDRDGAVAFADITRVLSLWSSERHDDPNDNGVVDFADITFILARWGRDCATEGLRTAAGSGNAAGVGRSGQRKW